MTTTASGSSTPDEPTRRRAIDEQIEALEGAIVRYADNAWQVQLLAHRLDQGYHWVHVALDGQPRHDVLLRMSRSAQLADVLHAVHWWLAAPGRDDGDVIEVE